MKFHAIEIEPWEEEREGVRIAAEFSRGRNALKVRLSLENTGKDDVTLGEVPLFKRVTLRGTYTKTYSECRDMLGEVGINDAGQRRESFGILGYTDDLGTEAVLLGFENFRDCFYRFTSVPQGDGFSLRVACDFQGACLAGGKKILLSDLRVRFSDSLSRLLGRQARDIARAMGARNSLKAEDLGTGWCSWYYYYGTETKNDILSAAEEMRAFLSPEEGGFILIDDGWNQREENVCVWGDWEAGFKYPQGMKAACDEIHRLGFKAGLWLAPFAVSRHSRLFGLHPEWLLSGKETILNPNEGVVGLDLTNPEVLEHLRGVFGRVFGEWGFDFVKIDFLVYGAGGGRRHDRFSSGVQAYRKGLEVIRACAGEKPVLCCGCPVLQTVGLCDMLRVGSDVGSRWHFPLNEGAWPDGNCSIKCSARYTVYRNWMNGVFWLNDPDCIVVRGKSNRIEQAQFLEFFPGMQIEEDGFGLRMSEAELWVRLIAFTRGMRYLSELPQELSEERRALVRDGIRKKYPPCRLADYYADRDLFILRNENAVAAFNVSDRPLSFRLPASAVENGEELCGGDGSVVREGSEYRFPEVGARSCRIFGRRKTR